MSDKFVIYPKTSADGKLKMSHQHKLFDWLSKHPNRDFEVTFKLLNSSTSVKLIAYYKNYVLDECRKGFYETGEALTAEQVDYNLRAYHTQALSELTDEGMCFLDFETVGNQRALEYLEEVKRFAAMNLGIVINDPE